MKRVEKKEKKMGKESFMQGVAAMMLSQILIKLLGLIYNWYLTVKPGFGDEGNAIRSAGYSIYTLLFTISSIGVPNAIAKMVATRSSLGDHKGAHRIFKVALLTFATIGLIGSAILFFGANFIANSMIKIPEAEMTLVALSPAIFFVAITCVFRGYFNGRNSIKTTARSQSLEQVSKTVFTILLVDLLAMISGNVTIMAAGANFATTIATFSSLIYLFAYYRLKRKELKQDLETSIEDDTYTKKSRIQIVKDILFVSIPMSLSSILSSINGNVDTITVVRGLETYLSHDMAMKQYGILSGKVATLSTLPLSFNIAFATALVPAISAAKAKKDEQTIQKRVSFSILASIIIALPCMIGLIVFAQPILDLLFPNVNEGAFILQMSALSILFIALEQTINGTLQGLGKIFVPAIALSFGVVLKIILNIVLVRIPELGAAGASIATAACHLLALSIGASVLKRNIKLKISFSRYIIKPILATGAMGIISYTSYLLLGSILSQNKATILAIIIAILIYLIFVFLLKIFTKEEIFMIPYGTKLYKFLEKTGIYKTRRSSINIGFESLKKRKPYSEKGFEQKK